VCWCDVVAGQSMDVLFSLVSHNIWLIMRGEEKGGGEEMREEEEESREDFVIVFFCVFDEGIYL